jgi:hypothetical protein
MKESTENIPVELELDLDDGIFELLNYASSTQTYEIEIDIMTTDGVNEVPLTVDGVVISTVCGPLSTTLTLPVMEPLYKVPNIEPLLSLSGTFTTSNPTCPVIDHSILIGGENYDLTDTFDPITDEINGFTITM